MLGTWGLEPLELVVELLPKLLSAMDNTGQTTENIQSDAPSGSTVMLQEVIPARGNHTLYDSPLCRP